MTDNQDNIVLPLCASCKFGLCIQQVMPLENATLTPPPEKEEWEVDDDGDESTGTTAIPSIMTYSAVCWWHPRDQKLRHPIEVMHVRRCSRYKAREEDEGDENPVSEEG